MDDADVDAMNFNCTFIRVIDAIAVMNLTHVLATIFINVLFVNYALRFHPISVDIIPSILCCNTLVF